MTTHIIGDRWSASSALAYLDEVVKGLPDYVLQKEVTLEVGWDLENTDRYWSLVPPEFASSWAIYRTPPFSLGIKILNYVTRPPFAYSALRYVRRKLRV